MDQGFGEWGVSPWAYGREVPVVRWCFFEAASIAPNASGYSLNFGQRRYHVCLLSAAVGLFINHSFHKNSMYFTNFRVTARAAVRYFVCVNI